MPGLLRGLSATAEGLLYNHHMPADLFGDEEAPAMPEEKARKDSGARGAKDKQLKFEEAFARLEQLVADMERGEQPLEDLLNRFEEGVKLVRQCQDFLKQAQLRVEQYVEQKDGHWVLKELE
jgi:exodeoxyribonuclease VII small subunit